MQDTMILWADDEIDLLKPHILFLNEKGYQVKTVTNGADAIDLIKSNYFDLVFLDENMPGLTGLETLVEIKNFNSEIPVVLITKNEEEYQRVVTELELFYQYNMIDLLKYVKYLVDTMRKNNIVWGVGRGSSVASYCLYLLGIHKINSLKFNLDIKEFLK